MVIEIKLRTILEPVIVDLGYKLWGIEFISSSKPSILRIYIDAENGIGIDDCERVSRQVAAVLDVEDPISSKYTLEVSSPGCDRPLFEGYQYVSNIGKNIKLRLSIPFDGRRNFQGLLQNVINNELIMLVDDIEYTLPLELVDKANVAYSF